MKSNCAQGLEALLEGLIDYAGLFPPARLSLATSLANYLEYRGSNNHWILGRFICPFSMLEELAALHKGTGSGSPLRLSMLASSAEEPGEFLPALEADCLAASKKTGSAKLLRMESLELKLPAGFARVPATGELTSFLASIDRILAHGPESWESVFIEIPRAGDWSSLFSTAASALASFAGDRGRSRPRFGLKLRCGGVGADDYPSSDEVALALQNCSQFGVSFKATAGLHQPLPHHDRNLGTDSQGFLNLFAGGLLHWAGSLKLDELRVLLDDRQPEHFRFADDHLGWLDSRIPLRQILRGRRLFTSFGSCSFEEPVEELSRLGLLRIEAPQGVTSDHD